MTSPFHALLTLELVGGVGWGGGVGGGENRQVPVMHNEEMAATAYAAVAEAFKEETMERGLLKMRDIRDFATNMGLRDVSGHQPVMLSPCMCWIRVFHAEA